jgi:hypothetical protein
MIATAAFEPQARYEAAQLGAERLRLVVVPHPFGSLTRPEVERLAESIVEPVREALLG